MSFLNGSVGFLKKLTVFVILVAIVIPVRYGSTNYGYLRLRLIHSMLSLKHSLVPDQARPTLSADYRAFESILRMKPMAEFDGLEDSLTKIKRLRSNFLLSNIISKPSQCQINQEVFEYDGHTVDTYWVDNRQENLEKKSDKILLYLHGGAYILGNIESECSIVISTSKRLFYILIGYSGIECHYSQLFNVTILHIEYRLSPEHPLPAAVEDTIAVYRALLSQNISPSQLFIMGDSAGGGLALLTVQALIAQQSPVPRGIIALSPWTDLSASGESYQRNRDTDVIVRISDNNNWATEQVLGPNHRQLSTKSPVFSPLFGSFEGFPSMYINVGTAEVLEDDGREVVKKAEDAGVYVTFEAGLHLLHCYPIFFPYYPEARNTLDNINKWIQTISS